MEHENQFASAAINNDNTVEDTTIVVEKKKKKGGFGFFKAAMLMLRTSSNNKKSGKQLPPSAAADLNEAATLSPHKWQRIVGSMRPLTLQEEDGSPIQRYEQQQFRYYRHQRMRSSPSMDSFEDAMIPPSPSSRSMSSSDIMSQYASANNLWAMDEHNGEEDNDSAFDDKPADDMIDVKAEQFIALFYAQMRSQDFD